MRNANNSQSKIQKFPESNKDNPISIDGNINS